MELCIKHTAYKPLYMADATKWQDIIVPGSVEYFDHSKKYGNMRRDDNLSFIWCDLSSHIGGSRYYDAKRDVHGIKGADYKQAYCKLTKKAQYIAETNLLCASDGVTLQIAPQIDKPDIWLFHVQDRIGSRWLNYLPAFDLTEILKPEDAQNFKDQKRFDDFMRRQTETCEYTLNEFLEIERKGI